MYPGHPKKIGTKCPFVKIIIEIYYKRLLYNTIPR
jgi:hypothetical protein